MYKRIFNQSTGVFIETHILSYHLPKSSRPCPQSHSPALTFTDWSPHLLLSPPQRRESEHHHNRQQRHHSRLPQERRGSLGGWQYSVRKGDLWVTFSADGNCWQVPSSAIRCGTDYVGVWSNSLNRIPVLVQSVLPWRLVRSKREISLSCCRWAHDYKSPSAPKFLDYSMSRKRLLKIMVALDTVNWEKNWHSSNGRNIGDYASDLVTLPRYKGL